jgi:hypothetical protein
MKTLKIIGKRFKIVVDAKMDDHGQCDSAKHVITLQGGMTKALLLDTLIHEITHAIDYEMNLEMTERQVHGVGSGLAAVFFDNPKFIDYLYTIIKGE